MQLRSVTETILQDLRVRIIVGDLAPGAKLKEKELSLAFGTSRAPLREAFRLLESEYLVKYYPRKGCCVTKMSIEKCREIFQVRSMMECFAVDLLEEKGVKKLPTVESTLQEAVYYKKPSSDDAYEKYAYLISIANFHIRLVEAARNPRLSYFYHSIQSNLARYQSIYTYMPDLMSESHEEHIQFLKLIEKGKYDDAKEYLKSHINKFVAIIENTIADDKIELQEIDFSKKSIR